ncbi:MAG: hypothetical protein ACJAS1_005155 [Oleiphilaceae bacterium]|jgi:hypothetical protein
MIKGIESNIANGVSQLTKLDEPNNESGAFIEGLRTFKNLLSDLNPFMEEESNLLASIDVSSLSNPIPKLSAFPDEVLDVAEEVSRSIFQSSSTTQKLKFDLSDISALQNMLADSLKASLLNTNLSGAEQSMGINSSNSSLLEIAALSFFESASESSLGKDAHAIKDTVDAFNYVPVAADIYKNTIEIKDKVEQQVNIFSSVSSGLMIGGPAGIAFTIADAMTQKFTGNSLFENFFEFGKETFDEFLGR